ncbi:MAG: transglutaminase domain-containing protein [Myxococcota bacterium]
MVGTRGDGGWVRLRTGRFVAERVAARPADPAPVDVARLLALPAPPFACTRRAHVGEYEVDGVRRVVETPTWPELPSPERERARALVEAVADDVRDAWVPGASTGGRGDCTEHAEALVARARAAGFAARTAAGRVYVDGADGPALVLHAWAELQLGGRWIPADAALRQFPADASHLRLGAWVPDLVAHDVPVRLLSLR